MARIDDIERGLLNWARYRAQMEDKGGNYARCDMTAERVDGGGWDSPTPIPTNDAEAEVYEQAVRALRTELRQAVEEFYLTGKSIKHKAAKLGCSVATVYVRIDQAHLAISGWLRDRRLAQDAQRQRTEALQRTAGSFSR